MAFRIWLFIAGVVAVTALVAAAYGAHALNRYALIPTVAKVFDIGQLYHMAHALALFGLAILLAATDGRRTVWSNLMINAAGLAFLAGIAAFSGGTAFMAGWAALALSAFGFHNKRSYPRD